MLGSARRREERSKRFYGGGPGIEVKGERHFEDGRLTLLLLRPPRYGESAAQLELTHARDADRHERGDAYGRMAQAAESMRQRRASCDLSRGPGETSHAWRATARVDDPDGCEIELLQGR